MTTASTVTTYKLPPPAVAIPSPPAGFTPTSGAEHQGVMPRKTELAVLEDAVKELKACDDFAEVFGRTVPKIDILIAMFEGGSQWSSMHAKSAEFDAYCRTQEGLIWIDVRKVMAQLRPVFELTVALDATVGARFAAFGRLLGAQRAIAQRAAAVRAANRDAIARGEPVVRGRRAKSQSKLAAKAALAAQQSADATEVPGA